MGRRIRVHPPATTSPHHQIGSSNHGRPKCHGLGFHEEHYKVVIGREPWPRLPKFPSKFFTSPFGGCLTAVTILTLLILLLLLLNFTGSRSPTLNLEALIVHDFNLTRNATLLVAPWLVNGDVTVVFQARNPTGFRHRYATTLVSAFYEDVLLGRAEVGGFSQGGRSARNVSSQVVIREQCVNGTTAASLRGEMRDGSVAFRVAVDARVKVKRLWWMASKWFNLTCLVDVDTVSYSANMVGKVCT